MGLGSARRTMMKTKRLYVQPEAEMIELKIDSRLLIGSDSNTVGFGDDPVEEVLAPPLNPMFDLPQPLDLPMPLK